MLKFLPILSDDVDELSVWAKRVESPVVQLQRNADPYLTVGGEQRASAQVGLLEGE
jgi:hypothetical protein